MKLKSTLLQLIKDWYKALEDGMKNGVSLEIQFWCREYLNECIKLYKYYGGTVNIDKYMKYYV